MSQQPLDYQSPGTETRRTTHPAVRWALIVGAVSLVIVAVWFILMVGQAQKAIEYMHPD